MNQIPERLINYRAYLENNVLVGLANVELPELTAMTDTISGSGIAGEVDSPIMGHYESMSATFTFRTIDKGYAEFLAPKTHAIDLRGSQQVNDAGAGVLKSVPVRVIMRGKTKSAPLGSLEVGATTDTEIEVEVEYLKIVINGQTVFELDKFNFKCVINGVDYLASVRRDMGM